MDLSDHYSAVQEGDDQAKQDQAGSRRARDPGDCESPIHRYAIPLVPVIRLPILRPRCEFRVVHDPEVS
jgi:hypothetical protein